MNAKAAELRATGTAVYAFGVGEPDFEPPPFVIEAVNRALAGSVSKYTAVTGIAPLKKAIVDRARARGIACEPENVTVSVGAKHALFNVALALYEPGDEVVLPTPTWVSYPEQVKLLGAKPVEVYAPEEDGFRVSPEALEKAINKNTKAIILCTPSNPTGSAYSADQMKALLDVVRRHDCWLIADEIYSDLVYGGFKHASPAALAPDLADRIVTIDGVSKSYAMTGWRIGWSITPKPLSKALDVIQGQSTTNPTALAQHAALAALTGPQEAVTEMRDKFERRRDAMVAALSKIDGISCRTPEGAFYVFANCKKLIGRSHEGKKIATDTDLAMFFLSQAHVATVPGEPFGAPGYIRMSYATSEENITAGCAALARAVAALEPA